MLCKSSNVKERDWPITKALFGLVLLWVTDNSNKCCKKEGM